MLSNANMMQIVSKNYQQDTRLLYRATSFLNQPEHYFQRRSVSISYILFETSVNVETVFFDTRFIGLT